MQFVSIYDEKSGEFSSAKLQTAQWTMFVALYKFHNYS